MINRYQQYKELLPDDFSIQHKITNKAEKSDFHIHDELEMFLALSDNVKCYLNKKSYVLAKNTMLLFNNMDLHQISLFKPGVNDRYVLYFKPEYINSYSSEQTNLLDAFFFRPFPDSQIIPLSQEQIDVFLVLLDKICSCYQDNHSKDIYGRDLQFKFLLGELLLFINRVYRQFHNITANNPGSEYNRIYSLINYVHKNLTEDLSLEDLSRQFFINKFHLCSLFKKVTGTSPNQYIINCRIMKAKELLSQNISVEKVCELVGYNNLSHFSRTFKRHIGYSPKKYSLLAQSK